MYSVLVYDFHVKDDGSWTFSCLLIDWESVLPVDPIVLLISSLFSLLLFSTECNVLQSCSPTKEVLELFLCDVNYTFHHCREFSFGATNYSVCVVQQVCAAFAQLIEVRPTVLEVHLFPF